MYNLRSRPPPRTLHGDGLNLTCPMAADTAVAMAFIAALLVLFVGTAQAAQRDALSLFAPGGQKYFGVIFLSYAAALIVEQARPTRARLQLVATFRFVLVPGLAERVVVIDRHRHRALAIVVDPRCERRCDCRE